MEQVKSKVQVTSDQVVKSVEDGKELHDHFAKQFRKDYTVAGKTLGEWKSYFKVNVPPDLNPQTCRDVDTKIMSLHQEASYYKAEAEAKHSILKASNANQYRTEFNAIVSEHRALGKKVPAAATLASLAEYATGTIKNAVAHSEIELGFWKEILSDLANARKIVEQFVMTLNIEAKAIQQERFIDRLNTQQKY